MKLWAHTLRLALALAIAACGQGTNATDPRVARHLDELERLAVFTEAPAFATPVTSGRRDQSHEPDFERREPATWREFRFQGSADGVLGHYAHRLAAEGWRSVGTASNGGQLPPARYLKDFGDWESSLVITVMTDQMSFGLTGQDATSTVCPG